MKNDAAVLAKKSNKAMIGTRTVEVKPLVIKDYLNIYNQLVGLLGKIIQDVPNLDLENFSPKDLGILAPVLPDVMKNLDKLLGLDEGTIENEATLDQLTFLIALELKVNNIEEIRRNFSVARAAWKDEKKPTKKSKAVLANS